MFSYKWPLELYFFVHIFFNICALSCRIYRFYTFSCRLFVFSNRPVTRCMFLYSWSPDIIASKYICGLKLCFRTNGLFTYPFSYRFVNICAFAYRRRREYTFLTDYLCFRTRLSRVACFCTAGIFTYTLSNSLCDLK